MDKHFGDRHDHRRHFSHTEVDADWDNQGSHRGRSRAHRARHKPLEKYSRTRRYEWFDDADDGDDE